MSNDGTDTAPAGRAYAPAKSTPGALAPQWWHRLIPLAFVTYSLANVDRSNYSLGAAGALEHSLHITSAETGLLGGLFFIGYFLFQVPAANFAERRSVKTLMFWSLLGWGVFAAAQGIIPWYPLLLVAGSCSARSRLQSSRPCWCSSPTGSPTPNVAGQTLS